MITDLQGSGEHNIEADWLVIGAGTVGLPVSVLLAKDSSERVVCLESGGWHQDQDINPLNEVIHLKSEYAGASSGRFRCLGGTSTRWGGAMIPFQESDLRDAGWPISFEEMSDFIPEVEAMFGLEAGSYTDLDFPFSVGEHHTPRLAKWPPFKKRNVYNLFQNECKSQNGPQFWLNSTVTTIDVSRRGEVRVEAVSPGKDVLRVTAKRVIIAAGAIETTRLAILLDRQNSGVITSVSPKLGSFFADHLSVPVAEILVKNRKPLNKVVGYRFGKGGSMRNLRFELSDNTPLRRTLPPSFCHISFETVSEGGFDALKAMYRSLQMNRVPSFSVFTALLKSTPWLAKAAWWRFVNHRLLYPPDARIWAHMVIEQSAREENKIRLSETKTDAFGVPMVEIDWSVTEQDVKALTQSTDAFEAAWRNTDLHQLGEWVRRPEGEAERDLLIGGGIYHPTGSTRMAHTASEGVVDRELRLFNVPEIQLLATSVLPNGGGANPTMMLVLLAMRCVQQHRKNRIAS